MESSSKTPTRHPETNLPSEQLPEASESATQESARNRRIDRYLSNLFLQIGMPANKAGFRYLREAIRLVIQDPSLERRLMRGLYPLVAERFGSSAYCVEHGIRCAITAAWIRGKPETIEQLLGRGVMPPFDRPTNSEFISLVAEKIHDLIEDGKL